jgi:hypothetical protein
VFTVPKAARIAVHQSREYDRVFVDVEIATGSRIRGPVHGQAAL